MMNSRANAAFVLAAVLTIAAAAYWPKTFVVVSSIYLVFWCARYMDQHFPYASRFIAGFLRGLLRVVVLLAAIVLLASSASASTDCTTRKSGSVTIVTCSHSPSRGRVQFNTHCRSYKSGSVTKTYCR